MTDLWGHDAAGGVSAPLPSDALTPRHVAVVAIEETAGGFYLRDDSRNRMHFLNATAMVVYQLCDGSSSLHAIAEEVAAAYALAQPPLELVRTCVEELTIEGLIGM